MSNPVEMPVVGEFVSCAGRKVTVRAATFAQALAAATAADNASVMRAAKSLVDSCASVEGSGDGVSPTDILTVQDCQKVVRMAQGDCPDFG